MPTYEYQCTSCGQHIEVFQRVAEDPLKICGVCGGALRKVFHPAGIVFKGSGFYATDSRSGAKPAARAKKDGDHGSGSSSDSSATSGSGSSSSSDSSGSGSSGSRSSESSDSGSSGSSDSSKFSDSSKSSRSTPKESSSS